MTEPTTRWWQLNLTCEHWQAAEQMAVTALRPLLTDAEDAGTITAWWFIRKDATWRVRLRPTTPAFIEQITTKLISQEAVRTCSQTIYEPETHAFGGPAGLDIAHDLFHADSRHLLDHLAPSEHDHRRELAVILATRLLRAAGQDCYEQGDCWTQLATHRTPTSRTAALGAIEPSPATAAAMQQLITATTDTVGSVLHTTSTWVSAVEHAGRRLAGLAAHGALTRGLRAVLTQHLLFLFNRHGIGTHDQYVLATAASRSVFGSASTTPATAAANPTSGTGPATLRAVTPADTDPTARADQLRAALADYLKSWGTFRTLQVEAAFRTVPRHLFLPGTDLDVAYGRKPVVTRRAAEGASVSSASSPKLVATMLEQLAAQPGQRVLEIGTATGINAALLAELVGPTGTVVTIELDDDLAATAAKNLETAGYPQVKVLCGDGALGHPGHGPYHRIIVTAEAWDLVPAWWDQLTVGGRLVVPLRLHASGLTRALGFGLHQPGQMVSTSAVVCGFVPLRGAAEHADHHLRLADDVVLTLDTADLPDHAALAHTLTHPAQQHWTSIHVRHDEPAEHLDLWLATTTASNFGRLSVGSHARSSALADPARRWAGAALYDGGALAYLTTRERGNDANELGVIVHGPDSATLAAHTTDLLRQWDHQRPSQPTITAHRIGSPSDPTSTGARSAGVPLVRPHTLITIAW
ncbi:MAG: methyltransferase, FxLD system [Actinomycetota bacterium]|nr:methyltransferase, FxLD system [Actinomycetota bacterium]